MKLGIDDVSISYEIPQAGKKKGHRRHTSPFGNARTDAPQAVPQRHSVSVGAPMNIINKPPRIGVENYVNADTAVRFADNVPKAINTPTPRRRAQSSESPVHARPVTPNKNVKTYGNEPRFPITSFRQEYQSSTPIPTITRVRKELVLQDEVIPWNRGCIPPNRDDLRVNEDMAKNLRRQKDAIAKHTKMRPGSAPAGGHKQKTIPHSFSRNRNSKCSGPILNLPYTELRRHVSPPKKSIHDKRWNIQTKDRDDEERARPQGGRDVSLHAMYLKENAYYRRNRPTTGGAINKTSEFSYLFR